jgi:hypothetical protein
MREDKSETDGVTDGNRSIAFSEAIKQTAMLPLRRRRRI